MNLLGKICITLILILSIMFMTAAMAVYTTQKNWRNIVEGPGGLDERVRTLQTELQQLTDARNRLESQLTAELEARRDAVAKLEAERESLVSDNRQVQSELEALKVDRREKTAMVAATQQNNERLTEEVESLRASIRSEQQALDKAFNDTLKAIEDMNQATGQLERAQQTNEELQKVVADRTSLLRANGIDPHTPPDAVMPTVDGRVSDVQRTRGTQWIEITVGSDDGIKVGHTVEVYRGRRYLGRAEVIRTAPDRAVAKVLRRFQQGQIVEGDSVATRIDVS